MINSKKSRKSTIVTNIDLNLFQGGPGTPKSQQKVKEKSNCPNLFQGGLGETVVLDVEIGLALL